MAVWKTPRSLLASCAVACLALAACHAWAAQPAAQEGDASGKILVALDALSPSKPDPKNLAALFQMRAAIRDEEAREKLDKLVAAGFIAAGRQEIYRRHVRPVMKDPGTFESSVQSICPVCNGEGHTSAKCGRCGGNGLCVTCKGTGKRRVNMEMKTLKGPTAAHQKPRDELQEVPCSICKGIGACPDCTGTGTKKPTCARCGGGGKVWDPASVNSVAMDNYDALHAVMKMKAFEASIPESVAIATADGTKYFAPVFTFGGNRVAALPARALTGVAGITLFTRDKRPVPFSSILVSTTRDLALLDLGLSSLVPPLEVENDAKMLDTGRHIYAYGTSRENDMSLRLDGKVSAAGPSHIATTLDSKRLVDCAPLITDSGKLGGMFMFPMAEFNTAGAISLSQDNGAALRLDNILPSDFSSISVGDLNLRNNALCFAKRAIKAAEELLAYEDANLALKKPAVSETVQRLDRSIAMLKGIPKWELFMMEATAKELMSDCETRARNLERRLADIARAEAAKKAGNITDEESGSTIATGVVETVAAPKVSDDSDVKPAKSKAAKTSSKGNKTAQKQTAESKGADGAIEISKSDIKRILAIVAVAIVLITVIFILIGVIQDNQRKKKLSAPPQIPDFIREMKEYERKHPGKRK